MKKHVISLAVAGLALGIGGGSVAADDYKDGGEETFHTVSPGTTLYSMANLHAGVTLEDIYEWNPGIEPRNLQIGQEVRVAPAEGEWSEKYHTVQPGESFFSIANLHKDTTLGDIYRLNPDVDPLNLQVGQKIRVYQ
ncbi:LysM peptidoglycan-binding domain-containing protein [Salimicrobium halophilum]|uniref:LysM domain-containing protein n=1 Tax=Salimicrobium halophilum TaxID=86666 RepID=A0A1G8T4P9_9BACI|nr:LysM domain-containing protein [Salimicrobium halophilum]SDJ35945.1 LysM domain-containing protein [Salimicrobium halophilum]